MNKFAKSIALAGATLVVSATQSFAAPLVSIGDTVDVYFRGSVTGQYRSNVFNNPNKEDDYVGIFSPGIEINIGRNSQANVVIYFREDFYVYNEFSSQDVARANLFVDGTYNSGPLTSGAGFSYVQRSQNTESTAGVAGTNRNLVKTDTYRAYLKGEYDISPKTFATGAFRFRHVDYTNNQDFGNSYSNRTVYEAPLNGYYRYTPKLGIGLGYRFRYTSVDNNSNGSVPTARNPGDYIDNFVSLALRGELYPKLTARLNVGWQNRDYNSQGLSSDNTISVLSAFDYSFSPKLLFTAGFDRDFGTAAIGQSTINTGGYFGANYSFSQFISAAARISVTNVDYQGGTAAGVQRSDDTIRSSVSVTYTPNVYLEFSATYNYIDNASNVASASFMGHTVDLTAALRY